MPSPDEQARLDAFFAEADDIIENWQPGYDAAGWAADGSHQPKEIGGDYYLDDLFPRQPVAPTQQQLIDYLLGMRREPIDMSRAFEQPPGALLGQEIRFFIYDEAAGFQAPTARELENAEPIGVFVDWRPGHRIAQDVIDATRSLRDAARDASIALQSFYYAWGYEITIEAADGT